MNWEVFWKMLIGVPVGTAIIVGCVWLAVEAEERFGWKFAFPVFIAMLVIVMATMSGMAAK